MGNSQIAMGNNQIAMGNNQIANGISPSPSGEVRWGLDGSMRSNNFYIRTKTLINPRRITLLLISTNHISPHLTSPEGEGQLLCN